MWESKGLKRGVKEFKVNGREIESKKRIKG